MNRRTLLGSFLELSESHEKPLSSILPDMIERERQTQCLAGANSHCSEDRSSFPASLRKPPKKLPQCKSGYKGAQERTAKLLAVSPPHPLLAPSSPNHPSAHYTACLSSP